MKIPPFRLINQAVRDRAMAAVANAPDGWVCILREETRTLEQNAKLHPLIRDVARQVEFYGKMRSEGEWKILFISGHAKATEGECSVIPGLEGEVVSLRESSASMSKARFSSLIEYIYAEGSQRGVEWSEKSEAVIGEHVEAK